MDSVEKELNQENNDDITSLIGDANNYKNNLILKERKDFYIKIVVCWGILLLSVCSIVAVAYDKSIGGPLILLSAVLGISALLALAQSEQEHTKFLNLFILYILPSVIYFIIAIIVLAIVGGILGLFFGDIIGGILLLIVLALAVLGLMFGPFYIKDEDIKSNISIAKKNILTLKNNEDVENKHIKYLQQKIQIAKESL